MKTLIVILVIVALMAIVIAQNSEIARRDKSRKAHAALWDFYHFIGTCKKTEENREYISDRLKSERAMNDEKGLHMVHACEEVFRARFEGC